MGTPGEPPQLCHPPVPQRRDSSVPIPRERGLLQLLRTLSCSAAPNIPNPASGSTRAVSHHKPANSKNSLESPNHPEGPGSSTRDPDPALPAGDTGSHQRALLGLGASSWIPPQDPLGIPGGSEPFQSCPMAQIPPAGFGATENKQPQRMPEP